MILNVQCKFCSRKTVVAAFSIFLATCQCAYLTSPSLVQTSLHFFTKKVRKGGSEDIPLVQGKEQWLCFAGAAEKRYPMPKVREIQVRW